MLKRHLKRKRSSEQTEVVKKDLPEALPAKRMSDEPIRKKNKWTNKQRVLVLASRGINHIHRHLMEDLKKLMPHHKPEAKMERSKTLSVINEMCEVKNCNKVVMFEGRLKRDLYMWLANVPNGPSVKFLVESVYTMAELKLTGNCLRGSRPLLTFDKTFGEQPQYMLLKQLLSQIFGVPNHHPKSQPFFDHVYTFTVLDNRVWFRNFQILSEDGALAEIGPRFVLNPIKIFSGSFTGIPLWENPNYISPAKHRQQMRLGAKYKYINRVQQKINAEISKPKESYKLDKYEDIFKSNNADDLDIENGKNDEDIDEELEDDEIEEMEEEEKVKAHKKSAKRSKKKMNRVQ